MSGEKNRGGRAGGPSTPQAGSGKSEQDTPSHVQRMVTRLGLTFKGVKDPRASRGQRHPLAAMLTLLVQALAVGRRVLRRAEALGEDMLREGTAPEGLKRPVSDTTLDRLLGSLEPEGLEQEVHRVVHRGLELGLIRQELFARGVVSIAGKAGESTPGQAPCEPSHKTKGLLAYNVLTLVRTHLPVRDGRPASFARTMEVLYQGLLGLAVLLESLATLA